MGRARGRDDFTRPVFEELAKRAGYACSHPDCGRSTIGPKAGAKGSASIGEASHITAAAPKGPRYDPTLTPEQRRGAENGIWLCKVHARLIDVDPGAFPAPLLRKYKRDHEQRTRIELERGKARRGEVRGARGSIQAYLDRVESESGSSRLLERLGRRREAVWVPLHAVPFQAAPAPARDDGRLYADRDPSTAPSADPVALETLEKGLTRIVLAGDPGSGKTEWLKRLALEAARAARKKLGALEKLDFPALLRLEAVGRFYSDPVGEVGALLEGWGCTDSPSLVVSDARRAAAAMLSVMVKEGGLSETLAPYAWDRLFEGAVVCLDGWDEVRGDRAALARGLADFARASKARIFLTTRIAGYGLRPLPVEPKAGELRLCPFRPEDTDRFLKAFFADDRARGKALAAALRERPRVAGLARNPLLATLLAMAFARERSPQLPSRRVEVYDRVLLGFLGEWRRAGKGEDVDPARLRESLRRLEDLALAFFPRDVLAGNRLDGTLRPGELQEFLRTGILVPTGAEDSGDCRFLHLTFQEHLAAGALARDPEALRALDRRSWDADWREVVVLAAGRLADPAPLLDRLSDGAADDLCRTRLALAGEGTAEVAGHPEVRERTARKVWDAWWGFALRHIEFQGLTRSVLLAIEVHPGVLDSLVARLSDPSPNVRLHAVEALAGLGPAAALPAVLAKLADLLFDPDSFVRTGTDRAVAKFGDAARREPLLSALGAKDPAAAAERLARAGVPPAMLRKLKLPVKKAAKPPAPRFRPEVLSEAESLTLMESSDPDERVRGMQAIGRRGVAAATAPVIARLEALLDDPGARQVRSIAAWAIAELGPAAVTPGVLAALERMMEDPERSLQEDASEAAGKMGARAATPAILRGLERLLGHHFWYTRAQGTYAVGGLGRAAAVAPILELLVQALGDHNARVRNGAAWALDRITADGLRLFREGERIVARSASDFV